MGMIDLIRRRDRERADALLSIDQYIGLLQQFGYQGQIYTLSGQSQEEVAPTFASLSTLAMKANGPVFACLLVRQLLFAEARFTFRQMRNGRPGQLFGTADLGPLETPWPGATTGDLLARMEQHASLAGNWFGTNRYGGIRTLRPDWVTMVVGSHEDPEVAMWDPDAELIGIIYKPGGPGSGRAPMSFSIEEIAHYAPIPDPVAQFRGMSWLTPIVREIMGDKAATDHKLAFFESGATPSLAVKLNVDDLGKFDAIVKKFRDQHEGVENAYRTLFLAAGADVQVVGADLKQLDFKVTQGAGETRIAAAAGVPPVIVGLSEGLQAATYSNYELAMRRLTDLTMRPLWRNAAGSLAPLVNVPGGAELWYDDRDIPALRDDIKKAGERQQAQAVAISTLVSAGFDADTVVEAVTSGDFTLLEHTGLVSVQLNPPGSSNPDAQGGDGEIPPANGRALVSPSRLAALIASTHQEA